MAVSERCLADWSKRKRMQQTAHLRGASMAVFRNSSVLLVRRARPPLADLWSLPGGKQERGESAEQTALREVHEETGVTALIAGKLGVHTALFNMTGALGDPGPASIEIDVFYGTCSTGAAPVAADDASDAEWVPLDALDGYDLTEGAAELILEAAALLADKTTGRRSIGYPT